MPMCCLYCTVCTVCCFLTISVLVVLLCGHVAAEAPAVSECWCPLTCQYPYSFDCHMAKMPERACWLQFVFTTVQTVDVNVFSVIKEYAVVLYSHNTCMQIRNDRVVRRKHAVLPVCFLPGSWCSVWPGWGLLHPGVSPEESPDEECRCTGSHPPRAHTNKTNVAVRQVYWCAVTPAIGPKCWNI